jgi:hypothetical protein
VAAASTAAQAQAPLAAEPSSSPVLAAPAGEPVSPAPHAAARNDDAALRAEVALLGRARSALQRHASASALGLLEQHSRRFAHGTLAPEAAALRIEALVQQGHYQQASAESEQFVATYPTHPLRSHVAELVARRALHSH